MRLQEINPQNTIVYSRERRAEVHCLGLNVNISKLGYSLCTHDESRLPLSDCLTFWLRSGGL